MIKKIFILIIFNCISHYSFSQSKKENNWGISFSLNSSSAQVGKPEEACWAYAKLNFFQIGKITDNSISLSVIPYYSINDDILIRVEFGVTNISLKHYYESPTKSLSVTIRDQIIISQSIEQNIYRYIPGIQWNFIKKKILESYGGITLNYLQYKDMTYHNLYEVYDLSTDTLNFYAKDKAHANGGNAVGLGAFVGFKIHFLKCINAGAEFSFATLYYNIGGEFSSETEKQNIPNPPIYDAGSFPASGYEGFQFTKVIPSLNIGFSF